MLSGYWNACWVNLREAGIRHVRAFLVGLPRRGDVGAHGIGAQEKDVAVSARGKHNRVCCVAFQLTGDQVAGNDATALPVDDDHVHHLVAGEHLHLALRNLSTQRGVSAQQELLTGLAFGIKRS